MEHLATKIWEALLYSNQPSAAMQELTFLKFFCGEGKVWKAVSASTKSSVGVDIRYWEKDDEHQNPFDILSTAGFGSGPKIDVHVGFDLKNA